MLQFNVVPTLSFSVLLLKFNTKGFHYTCIGFDYHTSLVLKNMSNLIGQRRVHISHIFLPEEVKYRNSNSVVFRKFLTK